MKTLKIVGIIAAVLFAAVAYFGLKSSRPASRPVAEMAANRPKATVNEDMPNPDAPRAVPGKAVARPAVVAKPVTAGAVAVAPVQPPQSAAAQEVDSDIALLLKPKVATPPTAKSVSAKPAAPVLTPPATPALIPPALPKAALVPPATPKALKPNSDMGGSPVAETLVPPATVKPAVNSEALLTELRQLQAQVARLLGQPDPTTELRAEVRQLQASLNSVRPQGPQASDIQEQVSRVNNNLDAMRTLLDTLILKAGTMEQQLAEVRQTSGKSTFLNQGNQPLVGHTRVYATATEHGEILANVPGLPPTIKVTVAPLKLEDLHHDLSESNSVGAFTTALTKLAEAGYDAHLVIGEPNPRNRPVWLEIFEAKGLTILHPELESAAFAHLESRKTLPNVFTTGAYGVTFTKGKAEVYRLSK